MGGRPTKFPAWFVGESLGTFLLVFFGCGSVAAAVLTGAQVGIFQVAIVWGIGIATAIYLTGSLSGAHLNPAVTVGFAVAGKFRWREVPRHVVAQFIGAFAASAALYGIYRGPLTEFEASHHVVRGAAGSEATAMIFGEFYPNPSGAALTEAARASMAMPTAFFTEALGTCILMTVILGSVDERNGSRPKALTAVTIGLTITILISLMGPLTMAGFNPARDLAPRLFSSLAGWGSVPFAANGSGWLTVYVIAPVAGAIAGAGLYRAVLAPLYSADAENVARRI
jgi:glycerol uptake facilitator protein